MKFDYNTATPGELIAEAERRKAKKENRAIAPSPADLERIDKQREAKVQSAVVEEYVRNGGKVWSTSQPRKAKFITPGGADLIVFFDVAMWFHEVKPDGKPYREDQLLFAAACRSAGIPCIGGGVAAARVKLSELGIILSDKPPIISDKTEAA